MTNTPHARTTLDIADAIEMVLALARENLAPDEGDFTAIRARQIEACDMLEDFAVNQLGDE